MNENEVVSKRGYKPQNGTSCGGRIGEREKGERGGVCQSKKKVLLEGGLPRCSKTRGVAGKTNQLRTIAKRSEEATKVQEGRREARQWSGDNVRKKRKICG